MRKRARRRLVARRRRAQKEARRPEEVHQPTRWPAMARRVGDVIEGEFAVVTGGRETSPVED